jgi:hypothetical protein
MNLGLEAVWQPANSLRPQRYQCSSLHEILMSDTEEITKIIPVITVAPWLKMGCYQTAIQFQKVRRRFSFYFL